jgi:hypothetical protein
MRQLGLHIGGRLQIGYDERPLTVVGTVTPPSIGAQQTDHVSLGRGVMTQDSTLLAVLGPSLGMVAGRWAWTSFGNALASVPARVAARIAVSRALRAE